QGWTGILGGQGNFGSDPLFLDPDGQDNIPGTEDDNARLAPASPCINAGDPEYVPPPRPDRSRRKSSHFGRSNRYGNV
ncbi:MAG: hypothetical protein ACYS8Z_13460, partial [Planctomycetota bacterium]